MCIIHFQCRCTFLWHNETEGYENKLQFAYSQENIKVSFSIAFTYTFNPVRMYMQIK